MSNRLDVDAAKDSLTRYQIRVDSVEWVGQSASLVFKVIDAQQKRYSLRFHESTSGSLDSAWRDRTTLGSEMAWLQALSQETDLVVPVPCKNNEGDYVTEVNGVNCTLLEWVEGEQKPFVPSAADAEAIGRMMGKLHKQAAFWTPPESFSRPVYDGDRIVKALANIHPLVESGQINEDHVRLLKAAGGRAVTMMNAIDRTPASWGLIHADLIPSNFVFYDQECRPIDFGACGFGYYLFDLGWTFSYIHPSFRMSLIAAYSDTFELPRNHAELLEGFFVAAQLETMSFWLGLPDASDWLPQHIDKLTSREFKSYVNGESFLFTGTPYWD